MRFLSKFRKFLPLLAIIFLFDGSGFLCPLLDQTPAELAAAATYEKAYCAPFKVTSATGFPSGPITISWTKMKHGNPAATYGYIYVINVYAIPANPNLPAETVSDTVYTNDPTTSESSAVRANMKNKPYGNYGSYLITIDFGYANSGYAKDPTNPIYDIRIDCSTSLEIKLTPPQAKKIVLKTATPTLTAQPASIPTHNATQAAHPTNTLMPPAATLAATLATTCPPGQVGNPSQDIPCMAVPK